MFALIFSAPIVTPLMPSTFWDRMASITNPDEDQTGSRQQRIQLFRQGLQVFIENPITGIGAGQFLNYDGDMMVERWRVTHNVWLQVAAELGIFGFCAFASRLAGFHVLLCGAAFHSGSDEEKSSRRRDHIDTAGAEVIDMNAKGMLAGLVGWVVCAFFASVAFNWTFYYVFALAVAGRARNVSPRGKRASSARLRRRHERSVYETTGKLQVLLGEAFFAEIQGKTVLDFGCGPGASFGPPWYHPLGGHIFSVFPWAHLVFSEKVLLRWRKKFRPEQKARSIAECGLTR